MLWAIFSFALIVALVVSMQPVAGSKETTSSPRGQLGRRAALAMAIIVPVLTVAIYTQLVPGTPQSKPSQSLADGLTLPQEQPEPATTGQLPDVDTMVQRLADRLKQNPNDLKGWKMLGWSYSHIERPKDAVNAYRHAVDLAPAEPELLAQYAEALVQEAGGKVTDEANAAVGKALAINASEPRARYLAGLRQEQQGKPQEAFETWNSLLKSSDINAEWVPELKSRLETLATKLGKDPSPYRTAKEPAPLPGFDGAPSAGLSSPHAPGGPSPAAVAAANEMSPESRTQMINGMVDRLMDKLSRNPRDLDGWLMLARSRMVLGDSNAARTAITKAREIFAGDAAAQARITDHMKDIGLSP